MGGEEVMSAELGGHGWCVNVSHSDYIHRLSDACDQPITVEERLAEMREIIRETGYMEDVAATINRLCKKATDKAFWSLVSAMQIKNQSKQKEE